MSLGTIEFAYPGADCDAHLDDDGKIVIDRWGGPGSQPAPDQLAAKQAEFAIYAAASEISETKRRLYDAEGVTVQAVIEAVMEQEEGRPEKMEAVQAARTRTKARADWPR